MNYKLKSKEHYLLCEAIRRYTRFHPGKSLDKAWTGLGTYTTYKPALTAGLMEYVHEPNPGAPQWWRLTAKGIAIVQHWIDRGYTYQDIEAGNLPPLTS